jgi:hypothetical protein
MSKDIKYSLKEAKDENGDSCFEVFFTPDPDDRWVDTFKSSVKEHNKSDRIGFDWKHLYIKEKEGRFIIQGEEKQANESMTGSFYQYQEEAMHRVVSRTNVKRA